MRGSDLRGCVCQTMRRRPPRRSGGSWGSSRRCSAVRSVRACCSSWQAAVDRFGATGVAVAHRASLGPTASPAARRGLERPGRLGNAALAAGAPHHRLEHRLRRRRGGPGWRMRNAALRVMAEVAIDGEEPAHRARARGADGPGPRSRSAAGGEHRDVGRPCRGRDPGAPARAAAADVRRRGGASPRRALRRGDDLARAVAVALDCIDLLGGAGSAEHDASLEAWGAPGHAATSAWRWRCGRPTAREISLAPAPDPLRRLSLCVSGAPAIHRP